ncbi:MAG: hypothetical protein HYR75_07500, partial [Gemmatimonadetes bacterium]|nr:hypothetical protein [Gemmatimonadota bacterium]
PPPPVTLTVTRAGAGTGRVASDVTGVDCGATCAADFPVGTTVTLTATADAGSAFDGWSGACSGTGSCVVTMDAAKAVTATFSVAQFALTVTSAGTAAGVVSSSPAGIDCGVTCSALFPSGQVVVLTASYGDAVLFAGWGGACTGTGTCTVTMDAAKSVTATFNVRSQQTLMVLYGGDGIGTVVSSPAGISCDGGPFPCGGSFYQGTVVTLTATADAASDFTGWTGACASTTATTCTLTMGATLLKVTPTFTLKPAASLALAALERARGGP